MQPATPILSDLNIDVTVHLTVGTPQVTSRREIRGDSGKGTGGGGGVEEGGRLTLVPPQGFVVLA